MTPDKTKSPAVRVNRATFEKVLEQKEKAAKSNDRILKTAALSTEGWVSYLLEKALEDAHVNEDKKGHPD